MKLSEAMMLGSATCKMVPGDWNSCALGAAGNAIGLPERRSCGPIFNAWPWLLTYHSTRMSFGYPVTIGLDIALRFDQEVVSGELTLEQLADFVKTIEPPCGECNFFDCTCAKAETADAPVEVLVAKEGRE